MFLKRYIVERTNQAEIRLKEQSEKAGRCQRSFLTLFCFKSLDPFFRVSKRSMFQSREKP